jgi:hypothetical protein
MSTPSIISQELFDETILENEECFDLSPTDALHETITQFCQQLGYTAPSAVVNCNNDNGNDNGNDSDNNEDNSNSYQRYDRSQLPPAMTHLSLTHPNYCNNNNSNNNERIEMVKFNKALSLLDSCVDDADGRLLLSFHNNDSQNNDDGKSDNNNNNNVTAAVLLNTFSYLSNQLSSSTTKHDDDHKDGDDDALLRYLTVFQQSSAIYTLMSFLRIIQQQQPQQLQEGGNDEQQQQPERQEEEVDRLLILNGVVQTLSTILTTTTSSSTTAAVLKKQRILHQTNNIRNNLRDLFIPALGSLVVNLLFHFQQQQLVTTTTTTSETTTTISGGGGGGDEEQLQKKILLHLLKLSINSTKGCEGGKVAFVQSSIPPQIIVEQQKKQQQQQTMVLTKRGGVQILFDILSSSVYVDSDTTIDGGSGDSGDNGGSNDNSEETIMNNLQTTDAACQLLSTLCRFDDFRTPSSSTTTNNNGNSSATVTDSSAGTTSSAHDHAMEFHRVNVELLLMKIARGVLNNLSTAVGCGDSGSGGGGGSNDKMAGVLERKEMLAASVLTALRVLAVNDEIIQTMVALGVLPIVTNALQLGVAVVATASDDKSCSSTSSIKKEATTTTTTAINSTTRSSTLLRKHRLTAASLGLLRNLCGNDEIKTNLCLGSTNTYSDDDHHQSLSALSISSTPSALPHLLHAMERYPTISPIQEHACGTLTAMALRRPVNARAIIDAGGPRLIITAMKRHDEVVSVQRQGALAIRNIVSRILKDLDGSGGGVMTAATAGSATSLEDARSEIRDRFHELGVEDVLRNITGRHQGSVDEAYAALRDLGYSVSLTKFNAEDLQDGTNHVGAVSRTMMFGEKHNSNFRPVYDESAGLNNAVYDAMSNLST